MAKAIQPLWPKPGFSAPLPPAAFLGGGLSFHSRGSLAALTLARETKLCRTPPATTMFISPILIYQAGHDTWGYIVLFGLQKSAY